MDSMRDVIRKWGEKAAEATKRAEDIAGNMWQHRKCLPVKFDCCFLLLYLLETDIGSKDYPCYLN